MRTLGKVFLAWLAAIFPIVVTVSLIYWLGKTSEDILGGMIEDNLQRTLTLYDGTLAFLWERPMSLSIAILILLVVATPMLRSILSRRGTS